MAQSTRHLTPPGASGAVSGYYGIGETRRSYTAVAPAVVDAHGGDDLSQQNWVPICNSGATSDRPNAAAIGRGTFFVDNTLNAVIVSDGQNWRSPVTGALV